VAAKLHQSVATPALNLSAFDERAGVRLADAKLEKNLNQ
jgi:hypothetical protein